MKTETKEIHLVNYYCPNNVILDLHNIQVKGNNCIIVGDFNSSYVKSRKKLEKS